MELRILFELSHPLCVVAQSWVVRTMSDDMPNKFRWSSTVFIATIAITLQTYDWRWACTVFVAGIAFAPVFGDHRPPLLLKFTFLHVSSAWNAPYESTEENKFTSQIPVHAKCAFRRELLFARRILPEKRRTEKKWNILNGIATVHTAWIQSFRSLFSINSNESSTLLLSVNSTPYTHTPFDVSIALRERWAHISYLILISFLEYYRYARSRCSPGNWNLFGPGQFFLWRECCARGSVAYLARYSNYLLSHACRCKRSAEVLVGRQLCSNFRNKNLEMHKKRVFHFVCVGCVYLPINGTDRHYILFHFRSTVWGLIRFSVIEN